ncbi:MAG: ATP-binding protein [bacterium]|nr:ATP-binding protein [bacterium]
MLGLIFFIIVLLAHLILGNLAFFKNRQSKTNKIFSLLVLFIVIWMIASYLENELASIKLSSLALKVDFAAGAIIFYFFVLFCFTFQEIHILKNRIIPFFLGIPAILLVIGSFTNLIAINPKIVEQTITYDLGPLFYIYVVYMFFYMLLGCTDLIVKAKRFIGIKRAQTVYVLLGLAISSSVALVFNLFLQRFLPAEIFRFGNYALIFFVAFTTYALLKHRFLDIRIVIKQSIVYGLTLGSVIILTVSSVLGVAYFAKINVNYWTLTFGLILGTLLFDPIKRSFQSFANKYLFTSLYNYQATIRALSQELTTTIDFEKIISYLNQIMQETMHVEKMAVLVKDQNNAHYNAHKIFGFAKKEAMLWPIFSLVAEHLEKNQALIVQEEMDAENALAKKMKQEDLAIALPLSRGKKLIGVIILGDKISADSYSKQDIELLEVLANQASVAIENALLYKEVRDFTLHLKEKVAEQTEDIKKLYAVKNDFLHIVSHQLRTPLSALNGLVSLWTDKDYEAQTKEEKDKIKERVKISCDRLSNVTNRMLDTLNFEKGRIILKFEKVDLGKIMQEIVEMLKPNFEKRGLYLKFTPLEKSFFINADPKYLSQVFQNLIDNGEKYTRQGGLTIQIRKSLKEAKIIFKDTGMGLEPEEKKYVLTEKFFRGRGAKEQYTGGTGLGLYLVKQIIDGHHGKIEVASAGRDQGTEFIVTLPVNWKK